MTTDSLLIDAALVRERRLELGLSERKLTAILGVGFSQTIVRGIETGTNHADLTLGGIQRLADALNLPLHRLLTAATPTTDASPAQPVGPVTRAEHLDQAVGTVAAVLMEVNRGVAEQTLAELAHLTLEHFQEILDELDARLRPAGLCVHRVNGDALIRAVDGTLDGNATAEAWRRHFARRGLNLGQVRLLRKVARGQAIKSLTNDERVRGAALVNAGILTWTPSGGFALSEETAFSLELDVPAADGPDGSSAG